MYSTKNYKEQGGEISHFGGRVVFEEDCEIIGLPKVESLPSESSVSDIISALKAAGYMSTDPNWALILENSKWNIDSGSFSDENAALVFDNATDIEVQAAGTDCWTVSVNKEDTETIQLSLLKVKNKGELIHPLNLFKLDVMLFENEESYSMTLTDSLGSTVSLLKNDVDRHASFFDIDPDTHEISLKTGVTLPETLYVPLHVDNIDAGNLVRNNSNPFIGVENLVFPDGASVDEFACYEAESLRSVVFEGDISYIGYYAFYDCMNLNYILIKGEIKSSQITYPFDEVLKGHFEYLGRVVSTGETFNILVEEGIPDYSQLFEIDSNGILSEKDGASFPRNLLFPDQINGISVSKVSGCNTLSGLSYLYIDGSSVEIDDDAFKGASFTSLSIYCDSLTIGQDALKNNANLDYLSIDADTINADSCAVESDKYFDAITYKDKTYRGVTWPEFVEGPDRFADLFEADNYHNLNIKEGVTLPQDLTIPHYVDGITILYVNDLGNSQTLETVRIHGNINNVKSGAFSGCSALETVYVGPAKYALFQTGSFIGCSALKDVYIHPDVYNHIAFQEGAFELNNPISFHYRDHIYYDYEDLRDEVVNNPNSMASNFTIDAQGVISRLWYISGDVIIPMIVNDQSVIGIADECCKELPSVTSVKIFSNIVSIGSSAFYGDTSLASVVIGYGARTIGSLAFAGCTALTSVRIKSTDITIDDTAFDKDEVTFIYDRTTYSSLSAFKTAHPEAFAQ